MKTSFALAASLSMVLVMTGCQKSSPPAVSKDESRVTQPQTDASEPGSKAESQADADLPDDPGMTTAHDKTVKQEQPSGDESSQAAPDEGDAEPPQ